MTENSGFGINFVVAQSLGYTPYLRHARICLLYLENTPVRRTGLTVPAACEHQFRIFPLPFLLPLLPS